MKLSRKSLESSEVGKAKALPLVFGHTYSKGNKTTMVTEAQKIASRRWRDNHKDKEKEYTYRATAKRFINQYSNLDDLKVLRELIDEREKELK